ncbi:MAG: hypothetical protein ACP5QA_14810, partial [Phycisphaerae bacterium]
FLLVAAKPRWANLRNLWITKLRAPGCSRCSLIVVRCHNGPCPAKTIPQIAADSSAVTPNTVTHIRHGAPGSAV